MAVDGHIGTWHTIDHKEIDGHTFWLMEHDTFGDDASCIIVDERGELVLSHIYDGFDETAVNLLRQEVMPVEKMPDDNISIEEMKQYGYKWGGMLPMREEAAAEVMKSCQIYRLYGDDTEGAGSGRQGDQGTCRKRRYLRCGESGLGGRAGKAESAQSC